MIQKTFLTRACVLSTTLFACAFHVTSNTTGQDATAPKRYALLVAVTKYEAGQLNSPPLQFPEKDASELAERLKAGGYEVDVLLGANANKATIEKKLLALAQKGNDEGAVVIGFFGHGVEYAGTDEAMFCPYDTSMRLAKDADGKQLFEEGNRSVKLLEPDSNSLVGMASILDSLRLCKGGNKLLLADCCRKSPNAARGRAFGSSVKLSDLPKKTAAIFACSEGEEAQEHPDWQHGAMTKCFLDLLPELSSESSDVNAITGRLADNVSTLVNAATSGRKQQTVNPIVHGIVKLKLSRGSSRPAEPKSGLGQPAEPKKSMDKGNEPRGQDNPHEFTNSIGMVFKRIPKGDFLMGSPESEVDSSGKHAADEKQHRVSITRDFYLGQDEVTQAQFERIMGFNPSYFSASGKRSDRVVGINTSLLPVENVSWFEAVSYCNKLSQQEGRSPTYGISEIVLDEKSIKSATVSLVSDANGYRLASEAEWEYACRAGSSNAFAFGRELTNQQAHFDAQTTRPATRSQVNAFGLRDMHGNVWEWCWDVYDKQAYDIRSGTTKDPLVSHSSGDSDRVIRSGGWYDVTAECRSAVRFALVPENRISSTGFRVALQSVR